MTQKPQQQQITEQEIVSVFKGMRADLQRMAAKIGDLETELEEHRLVIETVAPLDGERKCFRLMNGVLVERKVSEVLPALKLNSENIKTVMEKLLETFKVKEKELKEWQEKYQIRVEAPGQQQQMAA